MEMRSNTLLVATLCCLVLTAGSAAQKADSGQRKPSPVATQRRAEYLAPVELAGKWGYVDTNGKYIINPQFDSAEYFSGGLAHAGGQHLPAVGKCGVCRVPPSFRRVCERVGANALDLRPHWLRLILDSTSVSRHRVQSSRRNNSTRLVVQVAMPLPKKS